MRDVFGNLREWGDIPEQIAELREAGKLDEHQEGLLRILRYRANWRLRELALKVVGELEAPCEEILSEILAILADEGIYDEARILASQALADLLTKKDVNCGRDRGAVLGRAVGRIKMVLGSPQPPVVHHAVRKCLAAVCHAL